MDNERVDRLTEFRQLSPERVAEKSSAVTNIFSKLFRRNNQPNEVIPDIQSVVEASGAKCINGQGSDQVKLSEYLQPAVQKGGDAVGLGNKSSHLLKRKSAGNSVTQRINSILNVGQLGGEGNLVDYNQSHLRQYWMPDSRGKECYQCQEKFTTFRRRHHCRICGQIFCSRCCNQEIPGKLLGYLGDLRLCQYCCQEVIRFLDSGDGRRLLLKKTGSDDIATLKETLLRSLAESQVSWRSESVPNEPNSSPSGSEDRHVFGLGESRGPEEQLSVVAHQRTQRGTGLKSSMVGRSQFNRILEEPLGRSTPLTGDVQRSSSTNSLFGSSQVTREAEESNREGVMKPTSPFDFDLVPTIVTEMANSTPRNNDSSSLSCGQDVSTVCDQDETSDAEDESEPEWVKSISNPTEFARAAQEELVKPPVSRLFANGSLQMPTRRSRTTSLQEPADLLHTGLLASISPTIQSLASGRRLQIEVPREATTNLSSSLNFPILSRLSSSGAPSPLISADLTDAKSLHSNTESMSLWFESHTKDLLRYALYREGLGQAWFDVIWPLAFKIAHTVQPNVQRQSSRERRGWNISDFVHIKTLASTALPQANVTFGTVCSKAVADTRMSNSFRNPIIMLIGSPVEYERVAGKFCSIDRVIMQESEYLKNVVSKIVSHRPHVVIVQQSVARIAQEYFRLANVTLVYHVKSPVIDRITRVTGASLVTSIDGQLMKPKLGTCGGFRTETMKLLNGEQKTLMYFEDCEPNRCCSIVISGPTEAELIVAKKVLRFAIKTIYSCKLELAMLKGRHAICPHPSGQKSTLEDVVEDSAKPPFAGCEVCRDIFNSSADVQADLNDNQTTMTLAEALKRVVLTGSPVVQYSLPFLERKTLKRDMAAPVDMFSFDASAVPLQLSSCLSDTTTRRQNPNSNEVGMTEENSNDCQKSVEDLPFVRMQMTRPASDMDLRRMLAQYRAEGAVRMRQQMDAQKRSTVAPRKTSKKLESSKTQDILDPLRHSHVDVLFCSFSNDANNFCIPPKHYGIVYYDGVHDRSLQDFLNDFCFTDVVCRSKPAVCNSPFVNHIRRFVHGFACVEISMEMIEVAVDGGSENGTGIDEILTWDWCHSCKTASTPTSMDSDFRNLSIGRYVEYLCSAMYLQAPKANAECHHCLFHCHWQYFALGNYVACFKVFPVHPQEIFLPPTLCEMAQKLVPITDLVDQTKVLMEISGRMFTSMLEQLCAAKSLPDLSPWLGSRFSDVIVELQAIAEVHQGQFRTVSGRLQETLTQLDPSAKLGDFSTEYLRCQEFVIHCRFLLQTACNKWNDCRNEFIAFAKKQKQLVATEDKSKDKEKPKEKIKSSQEDLPHSELESSSEPTTSTPSISSLTESPMSSVQPASGTETPPQTTAPIASSTTGLLRKTPGTDGTAIRASLNEKLGVASLSTTIGIISPPFEAFEHFGLQLSRTVAVGVSEAEISSVVAYSLSSADYLIKLKDLRETLVDQGVAITLKHSSFSSHSQQPLDPSNNSSSLKSPQKTGSVNDVPAASGHSSYHIEVQFSDSSTDFYCKIYFAEHFRILRKLIFPQGEKIFINSLAHCGNWKPTGGKSGLNFFKTSDDRFILKQLSRYEVQSFMKFAAEYFNYVAKAATENELTALAKIMGVYRIGYRNSLTGAAMKMDVVVMENLFYRRNISQMFDLKGSMRNRLVSDKSGGQANDELVLLDENLLKKICRDPLYVHAHSKSSLVKATSNDSHFLSKNLVVDYSLLVGIDEEQKELVVGIIDYIRTYTWDKRLETFVKSVSVSGPPPTIVSPELYCSRFREAMGQYFLVVPEKWQKFIPKSEADLL